MGLTRELAQARGQPPVAQQRPQADALVPIPVTSIGESEPSTMLSAPENADPAVPSRIENASARCSRITANRPMPASPLDSEPASKCPAKPATVHLPRRDRVPRSALAGLARAARAGRNNAHSNQLDRNVRFRIDSPRRECCSADGSACPCGRVPSCRPTHGG